MSDGVGSFGPPVDGISERGFGFSTNAADDDDVVDGNVVIAYAASTAAAAAAASAAAFSSSSNCCTLGLFLCSVEGADEVCCAIVAEGEAGILLSALSLLFVTTIVFSFSVDEEDLLFDNADDSDATSLLMLIFFFCEEGGDGASEDAFLPYQ